MTYKTHIGHFLHKTYTLQVHSLNLNWNIDCYWCQMVPHEFVVELYCIRIEIVSNNMIWATNRGDARHVHCRRRKRFGGDHVSEPIGSQVMFVNPEHSSWGIYTVSQWESHVQHSSITHHPIKICIWIQHNLTVTSLWNKL